jgi:hypothetical protein
MKSNCTKVYLRFCFSFTKKYPNNASRSVVEKLLIPYILQNYKEALVLLEKIEVLRIGVSKKVTFYRGIIC